MTKTIVWDSNLPSAGDMLKFKVWVDVSESTLAGDLQILAIKLGVDITKAVIWLLPVSAKLPNSNFARLEKISRTNGVDNVIKFVADAGGGSDEESYWLIPIPDSYQGGNLNITVYATSEEDDNTKKAVFHIACRAKQDNETWDAAFTEIGSGFDVMATSTAEDLLVKTCAWTSNLPTAGELLEFKVWVDRSASTFVDGDQDLHILAIKIEED
jgi:hypothetical protein